MLASERGERKWEKEEGKVFGRASDWSITIEGYDERLLDALLAKLGQDGWELVSISPRSHYLGAAEAWNPMSGSNLAYTLDYAGFTSEELWVFKSLKP